MNSIHPSGLYGSDGWYIPSNGHYTEPINDSDYLWDDLIGTIVRRSSLQIYLLLEQGKLAGRYVFSDIKDLLGMGMVGYESSTSSWQSVLGVTPS